MAESGMTPEIMAVEGLVSTRRRSRLLTLSGIRRGSRSSLTPNSKSNRRPSVQRTSQHSGEKIPAFVEDRELLLTEDPVDVECHAAWLSAQRARLPVPVTSLRIFGGTVCSNAIFNNLYGIVGDYARENRGFSLDDVIEHLATHGAFEDAGHHTLGPKRQLVFAVLGWQSMIYQPAFNLCGPHQLAIHRDADNPDSGLVFDEYMASAEMCDRPLHVLLKSFGNLLPARSINTALAAVESSKAAASWTALYPSELNAYLLHSLLRVRFRWVDSLALHLDYDRPTRTLSLFGCPSMCVSQLRRRNGAIFAFASTEVQPADPRADEDDIAQFLGEVLLSFRLLFGQSTKSRRLFRHIFDPAETPFPRPDTLLPYLCSEKELLAAGPDKMRMPRDRRAYYAARDFPVLYERVELLSKELSGVKPKSMGDLLRDRRDTLQFWTFWLVAVVGGASIGLSLIQVVLQGIQIAQAAGKI